MEKAVKVIFKALLWVLLGIVGLVALVVFLLYLPPVQDIVVPQVLKVVNKPGEMEISLSRFRLSFPLDVAVDSLSMRTRHGGQRLPRHPRCGRWPAADR